MGLVPKIDGHPDFNAKVCPKCGIPKPSTFWIKSRSITSPDGYGTICAGCMEQMAADSDYNWEILDLLCQDLNLPWVPNSFEEVHNTAPDPFKTYCEIFQEREYEHLGWKEYWQAFSDLARRGYIDQELPLIKEEQIHKLKQKWGANYDDEELYYLEQLYQGVLTSQNVNGALQIDQAKKLCKTSLEIDARIRAGGDYDKLLSSYDKLVKIADFTPKNTRNQADFDSVGEVFHWLEKRGWKNKFFDRVTRDVVDETMLNIENFNRRLYVNESGVGEEITRRMEALQTIDQQERYYDVGSAESLDDYEMEGFNDLNDEEFRGEME